MGLELVQKLVLELEQGLGLELEPELGQHRNTRLKEGWETKCRNLTGRALRATPAETWLTVYRRLPVMKHISRENDDFRREIIFSRCVQGTSGGAPRCFPGTPRHILTRFMYIISYSA